MKFITFPKNKPEDPARKWQLLLFFMVFSVLTAFGQCPTGNVTLLSQAQIDAFVANYPNCTTITGNLTIGQTATHLNSPDILDLSPLNGITHITGNFFIGRAQNLVQANLNNLQQVGGTFDLGTNMTALTSASFNAITTIGGAFNLSAPNLTSLSGMNNLTSVGGQMLFNGLGGNPALPAFTSLTTITGNLYFQNTGLTSISGFPALQTLGGNFLVAQNSGLVQTISGFGSLTQIGGIVIGNVSASNTNMKSFQIGGESPITVTGDVSLLANSNNSPEFLINGLSLGNITSVGGNITLQSIKSSTVTGFQNLQTVGGGITVSSASNLTALDFGNLSGAMSGALNINFSPALTSITGISGLTSVGGLFSIAPGLANSTTLTQLSIPTNLTSVGGNFNISNTGLTSISGFSSLASVAGNFSVSGNQALTQISGFNNLSTINGNFTIGGANTNQGNAVLTQISGFGSLNTLGGNFDIYANTQLQTVNLSASTIGTVNGFLRLASNGGNLSTIHLGNITAVTGILHLQNITASAISGLNLNSVGSHVTISNTSSLTSFPFLNGLTSITGNLTIGNNAALLGAFGLNNLTSVSGNISFASNAASTSLSGWSSLASVGGNLLIQSNGLTSLSGLENLTSINGTLSIQQNSLLTSLSGLQNINSGITNLIIQQNTNLTTCALSNLCSYLSNPSATHPRTFFGNKAGGNCVNEAGVIAACPPPCAVPTALTATNTTFNSAVLGWTNPGSLFQVQWGTQGFVLGSGTIVNNITTTSHSLSGLAPNTAYAFYVRQNCSESESTWAGPFGFTTPQAGAALLFDGTNDYTETTIPTNLPLGDAPRSMEAWVKTTQTAGFFRTVVNYGATAVSQRFGILVAANGRPYFVAENNDMAGTVAINDGNWHHIAVTYTGGTNGTVSLYIDGVLNVSSTKTLNTANGKLRIARRVDGGANTEHFNGTIDEVRIWNYALTQCEIQTRRNGEISPSTNGLVSYYQFNQGHAGSNNTAITSVTDLTGNNNSEIYNFALSGATSNFVAPGGVASGVNAPEVELPSNLLANNLTFNAATLGWTSSGSLFDIQWGAQGFTLGSGTIVNDINGNAHALSGLDANTQYGFYVRQHCAAGGKTNWVGPFVFTTSLPCLDPTNLTASNVTISSANLSWTSPGSSFDIQYGTTDFVLGNGIILNNITSTAYNLSGLSYNTAYQFYVRQTCQGNTSSWAGPYAFSTPTFCPPGSYTLKTQAEVNGFLTTNPGCTTITGDLVIGHNNITYGNTTITDLSPLAGITHITGNLIIRRNYNIETIHLPNLTQVGGHIIIREENAKTISLPALATVGGDIQILMNGSLETVSGLNNLATVGGNLLFQQLRQTSPATAPNTLALPAFTSLQSIGGNLTFLNIFGLTSYTNAFPSLQSIGGILNVGINNSSNGLVTFTGFNNLTSLGGINVATNQSALQTFQFLGNAPISVAGDVNFQSNNASVSTLNLGNITSVGGNANFGNIQASQLSGFNPVTIGGNLSITNAINLNTVSNFSNLTSIGGNLHFHYLLALNSFSAFENLASVNGYIFIRALSSLTSLSGMQNIAAEGITNLSIYQNQNLATCELENFCAYLSNPNNPRTIFGNKAGGNCTNEAAVMAICVPPCNEPMGLSATNLTANTAVLGWNTTGNFELEWGTAGFTLGNGTAVSGNGASHNLSDLNPSTQYEFYVRQDCTVNSLSSLSGWAGPFVFTTTGYCTPTPYVASQSYGTFINSFSTTGGAANISNSNSGFSSGGYGNFSTSHAASQHIGEALSFTSVPGSTAYSKGFQIWTDWNKNGVFEVSEIVYTSSNLTSNTQTGSFIVPNVAEGNYRMRVMVKLNSGNIDPCDNLFYGETEDYTLTVLPALPCPSPKALTALNVSVNTADLNWGAVANAQSYNWIVVTSGTDPNSTPVVSGNATGTTVSVSGLSMETAYDFYVKSDCTAEGQSNWSAPYSFATLGAPFRFVKPIASGTGDGSSWANASADLQAMINGNGTTDVWVAAGTYKPIRPAHTLEIIDENNSDNAFVLKNNVKVYGGFSGTESNLAERNFSQNISILSGDFNNNGIDSNDAYHVVVIAGNLGTATLDGFTVTGGNATGSGTVNVNSRAISRAHSGGINIVQSPITLRNLTVSGNNGQYGGGIFLANSAASLNSLKVNNNTSQSGAGIKLDNSAVAITNTVVTGNLAGTYGGGIDIYGTPSPTLTNVTISGNNAETGGGICTNLSSPIIRNTVVYGNNTGLANLTPAHAVTYTNSLVEGITTNSNGNINGATDPMFADMPAFNTAPFTGGDFSLQLCSPIINKGNNTYIAGNTSDIMGNSRIFNGTVDLGANEVQQGSSPVTDLYASGLHTTTVTLGWDSEGTLFDLEWGPQGFTPGNGTLVAGLTVNSYTLPNLTFNTQYAFYVRESCGGNQSEWSAPFAFTPVYSICPLGYLAFTSQAQINDFGSTYNTCNVTTGHLVISGNDITDLTPLQNIVEVGGNFYVHNSPLLQNFNGLQNIKSIGGYIRIHNNTALTSISALTLNDQPNGVLDGYLLIENNPALTSLGQQNVNGLGKITEITAYLRIHGNPALASIDALSGLTGIGTSTATILTYRGVSVHGTAISSISAFSNLTAINAELNISDNPNLTSLQGLNGITSITGFLRIYNNGLTNLDALTNLTSIGGNLTIDGPALTSVTGLSNLTGPLNGHLRIEDTALTSLNGLQGITAIVGNQLFIGYNPALTDITALADINLDNITSLTVRNNTSLATCNVFCDYLSNDPATHPRYFTTNNGSCSNVANVIASCPAPIVCPTGNLTFNTQAQLDQFKLDYPNCTEIAGHVLVSGGLSVNNLDGLSNIQKINGGFSIWANHGLTSLAGLESLTAVASTLTIYNNKNLKNIDALTNLTSVGVGINPVMPNYAGAAHLIIQHNRDLENLDGLHHLTKFGGNITIEHNDALENIDGLALISTGNTSNLTPNIIKSVSIRGNESLVNIDALSHLTQIGYLYVIGNEALQNLNGLSNVAKAVGSVSVSDNLVLNDISGLAGLDINLIFGNPAGYNSGLGLVITNNPELSVCNLPTNLCTYLAGPKQRTISGNIPSCSNEQAAIASCQSCALPTNPIAVSVAPYAATFSWEAAEGVVNYNWIIIADNEDPDTATPLFSGNTTETTVSVSELNSNTHYDFYVKSDCNGTISNWSSRVDFFTEIICPSGNVFLTTQAEVNAFPTTYIGCTVISGNLTIGGISSWSNITDLSPLSGITQVTGNLVIQNNSSGLVNLSGLEGITQVGGNVEAMNNMGLTSLLGLEGITATGGYLQIFNNNALTSLSGLHNITNVGGHLTVFANHALASLDGLNNVSYAGNYLNIGYNLGLTSLSGLGGLTELGGSLDIRHNGALTSLSGLNSLATVGSDLRIWDNAVLENLAPLSTVTSINGYLHIQSNPQLSDVSGLANIDPASIGGALGLYIQENPELSVCDLANFCTYLANPANVRTISNNGEECTEADVITACTPVCDVPENTTITAITSASANFSWSNANGSSGYNWVVVVSGGNPNGTPIASGTVSSTAASVSGLASATAYDFYVRTNCSTINSDWSASYSFTTFSPDYTAIALSGYNSDIIAEGNGHPNASTSHDTDGWYSVFYNQTYSYNGVSPSNYLPANGAFTSQATVGVPYQLSPATGNNALRLTQGQTGALTFVTPVPAKTVFALITSGGSASMVTITVNFEDNTTQQFTNRTVSDWFNGNNYAIKGIGRVERSGYYFQDLNDNPRIYEVKLELNSENYSKNITSVTVKRVSSGAAVTSVMGISIENGVPILCVAPETVALATATFSTADFSWSTVNNAAEYNWIVVPEGANPDESTPVASGTVSGTTASVSGLTPETAYDFFVKANCGTDDGESSWSKVSFTTLSTCPAGNLSFTTQQQIDDFITTYPYCTEINGFVSISGTDITHLDGLINITEITGHLEINNNPALEDLNGLSSLVDLGGHLSISNNSSLTDLQGLDNINMDTVTHLYIQNNAALSACYTLPNICEYLHNGGLATISGNTGACIDRATVETSCPTIWNGYQWNLGAPDQDRNAIIEGNLTTSNNLVANDFTVNSGVFTLAAATSLTVNGVVTNTAAANNFIVESGANLVQIDDSINTGKITVRRYSYPLYRQDYTLWASPVEEQNLRSFSPQTLFNRIYSYDTAAGTSGEYVQELFTAADVQNKLFNSAQGYLVRMPNNWYEYVNQGVPGVNYLGEFQGIPNNGNISIPISTANTAVNLVGNPYPSSILMDVFFDENPGIERTLYFWRKRNGVPGSGYATCTELGLASPQPIIGELEWNNTINVAQGFFVKSTGATVLNFNNSMRTSQNGLFLRSGNSIEKHRFWLNLSDTANVLGQTLVGYATGATQGHDNGLDGKYFNESQTALTSLIGEVEYAVQGRSIPFEMSDVVPLGFKTDLAGTYTITLSNFDGLFETDQDIYLKDNFNNGQLHDLKSSAYSFASNSGVFNNRFSIVYQSMLNVKNPEIDDNSVLVYKKNTTLHVNAGSLTMDKIELFDIRGRLIYTLDGVNNNVAQIDNLNIANQVLIIKVKTTENRTITKKIIY